MFFIYIYFSVIFFMTEDYSQVLILRLLIDKLDVMKPPFACSCMLHGDCLGEGTLDGLPLSSEN